MKWNKKSKQTITVESYVTLRADWQEGLDRLVSLDFTARGHRVVNGEMEWQYFEDEIEAKKWSEAVHEKYKEIPRG